MKVTMEIKDDEKSFDRACFIHFKSDEIAIFIAEQEMEIIPNRPIIKKLEGNHYRGVMGFTTETIPFVIGTIIMEMITTIKREINVNNNNPTDMPKM